MAVDRQHADRALDGWRRIGKGRHEAGLNLGDWSTYALAADRDVLGLCTANDFGQTT